MITRTGLHARASQIQLAAIATALELDAAGTKGSLINRIAAKADADASWSRVAELLAAQPADAQSSALKIVTGVARAAKPAAKPEPTAVELELAALKELLRAARTKADFAAIVAALEPAPAVEPAGEPAETCDAAQELAAAKDAELAARDAG